MAVWLGPSFGVASMHPSRGDVRRYQSASSDPCRCLTDQLKQLQQAYLRFAAADFAVESCDYTHTSPTGLTLQSYGLSSCRSLAWHLRLHHSVIQMFSDASDQDVSCLMVIKVRLGLQLKQLITDKVNSGHQPAVDTSGEIVAEDEAYQSARAIIQHLQQQTKDIDAELSDSDRADLIAFQTLVQNALEPATQYTLWCEAESFSKHTQVLLHCGILFSILCSIYPSATSNLEIMSCCNVRGNCRSSMVMVCHFL